MFLCVWFFFFFKSYKHSKRERNSLVTNAHPFLLSFLFSSTTPSLFTFFVSSKLIAWPSLSMVLEYKTQMKFQRWEISWVLFSLLTCIYLSNKRSSLIQDKKPCEILQRAVRCETFSWVIIEWKITLLVEFVLLFSLLTCTFLLIFF